MRRVSVLMGVLLLPSAAGAQTTRFEVGAGLAAPTHFSLPERFEERGTQNTLGMGMSSALGVRFRSTRCVVIGLAVEATHLPGVSTGVAGLVRVSP